MNSVIVSAMSMGTVADLEVPGECSRQLRRADGLTKLLVACTYAALNSVPPSDIACHENAGLFVGTSFGPLETNFRFLDTLLDDGEGQASPTLFSHSVHNTVTGYLSRVFKITGPSFTINSFAWPFLTALSQAKIALLSGVIERAIVTTAEWYSPVVSFAGQQLSSTKINAYPSGAVCWILESRRTKQVDGPILLVDVEINEKPCDVVSFITRTGEEFDCCGKTESSSGLLSYAFSLTAKVQQSSEDLNSNLRWKTKAPFGDATVLLSVD